MSGLMWAVLVLLALVILYLWLIAPRRAHPDASQLTGRLYAHRGLHDGNRTIPENSLAAFQKAIDAGYGFELDVQLTADNILVVHHDGNTRRVCGVDTEIKHTNYADLPQLPDGTPIPTFQQLLTLVDGKAPMIVEVKPYGKPRENAAATHMALQSYQGPYCVESFHPLSVRYFRKHAPQIIRGQLAMGGPFKPSEADLITHFMLKNLLVNVFSRPHFVAYDCANDHNLSMWLMKHLFHSLLAAWTVRDQRLLDYTRPAYAMPIFELFTPDQDR